MPRRNNNEFLDAIATAGPRPSPPGPVPQPRRAPAQTAGIHHTASPPDRARGGRTPVLDPGIGWYRRPTAGRCPPGSSRRRHVGAACGRRDPAQVVRTPGRGQKAASALDSITWCCPSRRTLTLSSRPEPILRRRPVADKLPAGWVDEGLEGGCRLRRPHRVGRHRGSAARTRPTHDQGLCVDAAWGSTANGTVAQIAYCSGNPAQRFELRGNTLARRPRTRLNTRRSPASPAPPATTGPQTEGAANPPSPKLFGNAEPARSPADAVARHPTLVACRLHDAIIGRVQQARP
jgi:hypothetical protein